MCHCVTCQPAGTVSAWGWCPSCRPHQTSKLGSIGFLCAPTHEPQKVQNCVPSLPGHSPALAGLVGPSHRGIDVLSLDHQSWNSELGMPQTSPERLSPQSPMPQCLLCRNEAAWTELSGRVPGPAGCAGPSHGALMALCPVLPPLHFAPGRATSRTPFPLGSMAPGAPAFLPDTSGSSGNRMSLVPSAGLRCLCYARSCGGAVNTWSLILTSTVRGMELPGRVETGSSGLQACPRLPIHRGSCPCVL